MRSERPAASRGGRTSPGCRSTPGRGDLRRQLISLRCPRQHKESTPSRGSSADHWSCRCPCTPTFSTPPSDNARPLWCARTNTARSTRCDAGGATSPRTRRPPATPAVLAREIGYDVALLELAEVLGIARPIRAGSNSHGTNVPAWSRRSWTAASRCRQHPTPRTLRRRQLESVPATAVRCRGRRWTSPGSSAR